jgi:hypothetical protein
METATAAAASQLGVSQRQVQRLARNGRLVSREIAGRTVVAGRSVVAMSRSSARGRRWEQHTVAAACELLEKGSTARVSGSQRSRLRSRLRTIPLAELAYQVLGDRVTLWRSANREESTTDRFADGLSTTGERLDVKVTHNAATLTRRLRMIEDADGDTIVIELEAEARGVVEDIVLYAYGDVRTSIAAAERIRARQEALK